ncbi:myrosinase 1-like isoform X2 [Formica exsecta]|uniref:myrosinase 1-like isoform X2 n=1 Tax=Formica exsecta TaxID=72781 RepID=UPI001144504D|nr:myrosinase 1-like isoform X2 [Formica exsecta]
MWFSIDLNTSIIYLKFYGTIIIYFTQKHISYILSKEDSVTYKFSQEQIYLANLLARNTFPEDFLFGVSAPVVNNERELRCMIREESECIMNNVTRYTNFNLHYKEDILFAKSINSKMFKMSLSWTRIMPHGFTNFINQDAIQHYNTVINEIIANGMTPMVTIFDWDLPLNLQLLGGCTNPMLVKWFQDYARIIFDAFGDRVKFWVTINEVNLMAYSDRSTHIAAINQSGIADYLCGHYMLLAHAKVYNMYNENFRQSQNGKVGIIQFYTWMELQNDDSQADIYGQRRGLEWYNGWLTHPIFSKSGDYSKLMRNRIDFKSLFQGFSRSRLPYFTDKEVQLIKDSADFLGINFWREFKIRAEEIWKGEVSFKHDADIAFLSESESIYNTRTEITMSAFGKLLEWLDNNYILPDVYIIENGCANIGEIANNEEIMDINRIIYLRQYISQVMKAMQKGINIRGYLICSLIDSFLRNSNFTRTSKSSSKVIAEIFKTRVIHLTIEPERAEITSEIDEEII